MAATKLLDILKCVRPILFENDDPAYKYSLGGTAFVVKFKGAYYVVTAKHALLPKSFSVKQTRIQYKPDGRELLPIERVYRPEVTDAEDDDQFDLTILGVSGAAIDPVLFGEYKPYELLEMDKFTIFGANSHFLYRGFPDEFNVPNWDDARISQTSVSGNAAYKGPTGHASTHYLEFLNLDPLSNLSGLSGAPVFQVVNEGEKYSIPAFAGMLLRGTRSSRTGRFLEHRRIIECLRSIHDGEEKSR